MFAPGAAELAREFNITDSTVKAMTVSLYVLGFAFGPLLLAPLSELYGRLVIYYYCNLVYIAFTLGCAFSTNDAMFLAFRIICGCAASGPMSVGGGTVADLFPQKERGKAMSLFTVGPLLGPVSTLLPSRYNYPNSCQVIGPIIGGFVSENVGWRWTFRILLILVSLMIESKSRALLNSSLVWSYRCRHSCLYARDKLCYPVTKESAAIA
jgi:MFS family permease